METNPGMLINYTIPISVPMHQIKESESKLECVFFQSTPCWIQQLETDEIKDEGHIPYTPCCTKPVDDRNNTIEKNIDPIRMAYESLLTLSMSL